MVSAKRVVDLICEKQRAHTAGLLVYSWFIEEGESRVAMAAALREAAPSARAGIPRS
jgi:hypothetical protein